MIKDLKVMVTLQMFGELGTSWRICWDAVERDKRVIKGAPGSGGIEK